MMNTTDTRSIIGNAIRPCLEQMEDRRLMSGSWLESNTLNIQGSNASDRIVVFLSSDGQSLWAKLNGNTSPAYRTSDVHAIHIRAGNGNNRIAVGENITIHTVVETGSGNDIIRTGNGSDIIRSGGGADVIFSRGGNDLVDSGTGRDRVNLGTGNDTLDAGPGDDIITADEGFQEIYTRTGSDTLYVTSNANTPDLTRHDEVNYTDDGYQNANVIAPSVVRISLIDADTGLPIAGYENINAGKTLDLALLPARVNIAVSVGSNTESVRFELAGDTRTDNDDTYTLAASTWTPVIGAHSLRVTPYSCDNATGIAGTSMVVPITVLRSQQPVTPVSVDAPRPAIDMTTDAPRAGHAVHFRADRTTVPDHQIEDASFVWDFGDGSTTADTSRGFNTAYVYTQPGDYTVRLTVTGPTGLSSTATFNVNVAATDLRVVYVSGNGNDSNLGNSNKPFKTLARAVQVAGSNALILVRRGDRFDISQTIDVNGSNITISSYGVGEQPVLNWTGARERKDMIAVHGSASHVMISGLTFDSIYQADTGQQGMPIAIHVGGSNVTVMGNTFHNVGFAVNANWSPSKLAVIDNRAPLLTGIRDYFVWAQGSDIVIVNNVVANSTREHIVRVGGVDRIAIVGNNFSNLDRRSVGDPSDSAKGAITNQKGTLSYIALNQINGPAGIGPLGLNDGLNEKQARFKHAVAEGNTYTSQLFVQHGAEHITLRHNVFKNNGGIMIQVDGFNSTYNRGVVDLSILDNTGFNTASTGNFLNVGGSVDGITLTGNLLVAPNLAPGSYSTAAVYVNQNSLSSFRKITGNIWPANTRASSWAQGGMMFVGTSYTGDNHYSPAEWNALSVVGEDLFMDVALASNATSTTQQGRTAGARLAA
jgi:hypothetical protein